MMETKSFMLRLKERWLSLSGQIDRLPLKERVMCLIGGCVLVFLLWWLIFELPMSRDIVAWQKKQQETQNRGNQLKEKIQMVQIDMAQGPLQQQLDSVMKQTVSLDQFISKVGTDVLPGKKIRNVLHDLLMKQGKLKLISLENLADEPVLLQQNSKETSIKLPFSLFAQGILLTFSGNYFDVMHYLQSVERLHWKIFFSSLDYSVSQYPQATVQLRVYTLSRQRED